MKHTSYSCDRCGKGTGNQAPAFKVTTWERAPTRGYQDAPIVRHVCRDCEDAFEAFWKPTLNAPADPKV